MKFLQFSAFGEVADIAEPNPQAGEVVAAVEYAPINPSELLMIRGFYGVKPPLPDPLGQEGVAQVVALGHISRDGRSLRRNVARWQVPRDRPGHQREDESARRPRHAQPDAGIYERELRKGRLLLLLDFSRNRRTARPS